MMLTYEKIFGCDDTYHEVLEKSGIAGEPVKADVAYATNLVDGVQKHIDKIDETISEAAIGWTLERMSKVDLQSCAMQHMRSFSTETFRKLSLLTKRLSLQRFTVTKALRAL